MNSRITVDGDKVTVQTGELQTTFRNSALAAAEQIAILHEIVVSQNDKAREMKRVLNIIANGIQDHDGQKQSCKWCDAVRDAQRLLGWWE